MKKLLFTNLLGLVLLLPANFLAAETSTAKTEFSTTKPKKKSKKRKSTAASRDRGCTYNGHTLYVGERGGCYYYTGSSKKYVGRAYCSSCN